MNKRLNMSINNVGTLWIKMPCVALARCRIDGRLASAINSLKSIKYRLGTRLCKPKL